MRIPLARITGAAAALLMTSAILSGCGDDDDQAEPAGRETGTWIEKNVGDEAGALCDGDELSSCALLFTVTEISAVPLSECNEYSDLPDDSRVVRVKINTDGVRTPPSHYFGDLGDPVSASNWSGVSPDGYSTKAEVAIGCGALNEGAFYESVKVGQKLRGDILFAIPADATQLELSAPGNQGGWRWGLPDGASGSDNTVTSQTTDVEPTRTEQQPTEQQPTGSTPVLNGPCLDSELRTFATDANGTSLVCTYMGAGNNAWVGHAPNSGEVHNIGDPCDSAVDSVAQDPSGKAIMCGGDTWVGGP